MKMKVLISTNYNLMAFNLINGLVRTTISNMRKKPGYITASSFFVGSMAYTFYRAPQLEDPILRYACAGTAATLFCEVIMHSVDTVNMRSKIINGPKLYVFELIKHEGIHSLFRGI